MNRSRRLAIISDCKELITSDTVLKIIEILLDIFIIITNYQIMGFKQTASSAFITIFCCLQIIFAFFIVFFPKTGRMENQVLRFAYIFNILMILSFSSSLIIINIGAFNRSYGEGIWVIICFACLLAIACFIDEIFTFRYYLEQFSRIYAPPRTKSVKKRSNAAPSYKSVSKHNSKSPKNQKTNTPTTNQTPQSPESKPGTNVPTTLSPKPALTKLPVSPHKPAVSNPVNKGITNTPPANKTVNASPVNKTANSPKPALSKSAGSGLFKPMNVPPKSSDSIRQSSVSPSRVAPLKPTTQPAAKITRSNVSITKPNPTVKKPSVPLIKPKS